MEQINNLNTDVYLDELEIEKEAQIKELCVWGAARSAAIAISPRFSCPAMLANDVYMVVRIAQVYGKPITTNAALGFLLGLGGSAVGALVCSVLPTRVVKVPLACAITYAIGMVAAKWVRDGMPTSEDFEAYRQRLLDIYAHNKETIQMIVPKKGFERQPMGDESVDFLEEAQVSEQEYLDGAKGFASSFLEKGNLGAIKDAVVGTTGVAVATVLDVVSKNVSEETMSNISHAAKGVGSLLSTLGEQALFLLGSVASSSTDKATKYANQASHRFDEMKSQLEECYGHVPNAVSEGIQEKASTIQAKVEPTIHKVQDTVVDLAGKAEPTLQKVQDKVQDLVNKVEPTVQKVQDKMKDLANKVEPTVEKVQDKVQDLADKVEPTVQKVQDKVQDLADKVEPTVQKAQDKVQDLADKVEPTVQKVQDKVQDLADKVEPTVQKAQDKVQDLAEKGEAKVSDLKEKAEDLAQKAKDQLK